jgi:SAM-dependent methyltransferase
MLHLLESSTIGSIALIEPNRLSHVVRMHRSNAKIRGKGRETMPDQHTSHSGQHLSAAVDWAGWLQRWDTQQTAYLPDREARFTAMLDVLDILLPESFVALDLACGPGAISQRLLSRFPKARSIAVDLDPVLLTMGQAVVGNMGGRLRWVEANLTTPEWVSKLGEPQIDAALSTTALHWLPPEYLTRVYRELGQLIRPGGVFLNGDNLKFGPHAPSFQKVAQTMKERTRQDSFERRGLEDWESWWKALQAEPALQELLAERERRFSWKTTGWQAPIFDLHVAALRDGGFREVDVIWQNMEKRVLMAVR